MAKKLNLSQDHVEKMQSGRRISSAQRADAMKAVAENPQFQNFRFWKGVDEDIIEGILKAIDKAHTEAIKKKIEKLESEIEGLREQL
jgi:hypothetical protein